MRSAQLVDALLQRWSAPSSDRERSRVESLIATMDPDFVGDVLARIDRPEAERVRALLPGWPYIGSQPSRAKRDGDRAHALAHAAVRDRLNTATVDGLQALLSGSELERAVALELLGERGAVSVDQMLQVYLRDPSQGVRSRAESMLDAQPPDVLRLRWEVLMNDTAWTVRFHASHELEEDLVRLSTRTIELSRLLSGGVLGVDEDLDVKFADRSLEELREHGISADEFRCERVERGWLLECSGRDGDAYSDVGHDAYYVSKTADGLAVIEAKLRPGLAVFGGRFGESAMPALERLLQDNPPYARAALIEAWGMIGTEAALARLAEQLAAEVLDPRVVRAIVARRHPAAKALLQHALEATQVSSDGFDVDVEHRIRELTHGLVDLGAVDTVREVITAQLDSSDGSRHLLAADILLAHRDRSEKPLEDLAMRACADADPHVRRVGMALLDATQDRAGREVLLQACIREPVDAVWRVACESFRQACIDDDLLRLRAARTELEPATRARVIGALAIVGDDTAISDLRDALADPVAEIRELAADGLRRLCSPLEDPEAFKYAVAGLAPSGETAGSHPPALRQSARRGDC